MELSKILADLHAHGLAALEKPDCSNKELLSLLADYYRAYRALLDFVQREAEAQ